MREKRLIDIEIGAGDVSNYLGPKFAQRAVLFNTLSDITNKDRKSGSLPLIVSLARRFSPNLTSIPKLLEDKSKRIP